MIVDFDEFIVLRQTIEDKLVLCHGCFDLLHIGHIKHLQEAKKYGIILVVSITPDIYVNKGPNKPIFTEQLRAEALDALDCVDYVVINKWPTAENTIKEIKPDVYVKGSEYESLEDITGNIKLEYDAIKAVGGEIKFTHEVTYSSSNIINSISYSEEAVAFLKHISSRYKYKDISDALNSVKDLKVLVLGDGIVDEYCYCESLGKSAKGNTIVNKYLEQEEFIGGAFIIANHLAGICNEVDLISMTGTEYFDFIKENLKSNVHVTLFVNTEKPTIVKRRYINKYLNQKLFEINYLDDTPDNRAIVINFLSGVISKYDLVIVSDFGHGLITPEVIQYVKTNSKMYAVNTQTNAANTGYNLITKYKSSKLVCLDENEARLATQNKFGDIRKIIEDIAWTINSENVVVTLGKKGSIGYNKRREMFYNPALSTTIVDTVGAGDAFFSFVAPLLARNVPLDLAMFVANVVGSIAVQIVGNKRPVEKEEVLQCINTLMK